MSQTNTGAVCFEKSKHHLPHIEYNKLLNGASILAKPGHSSRSCYSWFKYWPGPLTGPVGWMGGEVEMRYDFEVHQKTGSDAHFPGRLAERAVALASCLYPAFGIPGVVVSQCWRDAHQILPPSILIFQPTPPLLMTLWTWWGVEVAFRRVGIMMQTHFGHCLLP